MITDIAAALYARLAEILVDDGLPPLTDGKIVLGRQHVLEQTAPPRIIMIPVRSLFMAQGETAAPEVDGETDPQQEAWLARSLLTDQQFFEIWAWAAASPTPDPDADFDAAEALYKRFLRALHQLTHGAYALGEGEWFDQREDQTQLVKLGHMFRFTIGLDTPVQDDSLAVVPTDTEPQETVTLENEGP